MSKTIWLHWAWTALYSGSPVKFAMLAPSAKSVVCQICFMSPPMSSVPAVDNAWDFAWLNIELIFFNCIAESDVSLAEDASASLLDALVIA